jgi:hypothetical protein
VAVALGVLLAVPAQSGAGLLKPTLIDANTGKDAVPIGASIGNRRGWSGFIQETGGKKRLYVAYARNGGFRAPVLADRGNEVTFGGLAGNEQGQAFVFFTEKVGNNHVIFARRLEGGRLGALQQVSPDNQNTGPGSLVVTPYDRGRGMDMSADGSAVVLYTDVTDANNPKPRAATLAPGGDQWTRHDLPAFCSDPRIDGRGNVACVGRDNNMNLYVLRIVGGQVKQDLMIAPNAMDQFSMAVSPGGMGIALGRTNQFHVFAFRKRDIGQDGPWESLGFLEEGVIQANADPEDPFGAINRRGDGILVFRDNSMNNPQGYYRLLRNGDVGSGGVISKSMSRERPAIDSRGARFVLYEAADFKSSLLHRFTGADPGSGSPLAPGREPYFVGSLAGFQVSEAGDMLAIIRSGENPSRLESIFGDFQPPTAKPRSATKRPRVGRSVRLRSRAMDTFADPRSQDISWKVSGGVTTARTFRGKNVSVRFRRPGRYRFTVTVRDLGGNQVRKTLRVRVRR